MKKTILCLLCLVSLVALTALTASAETTLPETCSHCQKEVTWEPVTEFVKELPDGHYYLAFEGDSLDCYAFYINGNVCLNMNGKTLVGDKRTFYIYGTLNLFGEGTVMGNAYEGEDSGYGGDDAEEEIPEEVE